MMRSDQGTLAACSQPATFSGNSEKPASETGARSTFRIRVANDAATRERAYRLAFRIYQAKGYVQHAEGEGEAEWIVRPYDVRPETLTLLAEDAQGNAVATISLVFDGRAGLPCDEIFGEELAQLRGRKRRIVEVTRLAISERHTHSKLLLVRLFNWIHIYARRLHRRHDFVIEVNPRHASYYRRLLGFETLGVPRPCPRVQGAPAVLMRLDLSFPEQEIGRVGGRGTTVNERSLYPFFLKVDEEQTVVRLLRRGYRRLSKRAMRYFGLSAVGCRWLTK